MQLIHSSEEVVFNPNTLYLAFPFLTLTKGIPLIFQNVSTICSVKSLAEYFY